MLPMQARDRQPGRGDQDVAGPDAAGADLRGDHGSDGPQADGRRAKPAAPQGPADKARGRRADSAVVKTVAVLFARRDSVYKTLDAADVWDEDRDARLWTGGLPVVAHPPCRLWAKLRQFAKASDPAMEMQLARDAVAHVRQFGGVLEHPAESTLWADRGLPKPGRAPDDFGGWTAQIRQCDWGHKAEKLTWLYIVGCHPDNLPPVPPRAEPVGVIKPQRGVPRDGRKIVTKADREHTPEKLAIWLVEVASRCKPQAQRWRAGAVRAKAEDGTWQVAEPHDPWYSTVTMVATEWWDQSLAGWRPIFEDAEAA